MHATTAMLYSIMLVIIIVVHRHHSWVKLLVAFLWKACMVPSGTMIYSPQVGNGDFQISSSSKSLVHVSQMMHGVFSSRDLLCLV